MSLFSGWFPHTVQALVVVLLLVAVVRRRKRWWTIGVPLTVVAGVGLAAAAWWYVRDQGLSGDPAPRALWGWIAVAGFAVGVAVVGWWRGRWWQRTTALLSVPAALLCVGLVLNQWVGYYTTVTAAWQGVTAQPLPGAITVDQLAALRDTSQPNGRWVKVSIPSTASGFAHRAEYVYLPPAWFTGTTTPTLPVVMMIGGEFNTPADWVRSGNLEGIITAYAHSHHGETPILVLVDAGGSFNNDTECVDGPRGNVADHLTKDVPTYIEHTFHAAVAAKNWAVVGWSMGGTCALDLVVMHPDKFATFLSIAGDVTPNSGTTAQTLARLYGGNKTLMASYDPATVAATRRYQNVAGAFIVSSGAAGGPGGGTGSGTPQGPTEQPSGSATASSSATSTSSSTPQQPTVGGHAPGGHAPGGQAPGGQPGSGPASSSGTGLGGQDADQTDTFTATTTSSLYKVLRTHGIQVTVISEDEGHTWQLASTALQDSLAWLAGRIGTPDSPTTTLKTS